MTVYVILDYKYVSNLTYFLAGQCLLWAPNLCVLHQQYLIATLPHGWNDSGLARARRKCRLGLVSLIIISIAIVLTMLSVWCPLYCLRLKNLRRHMCCRAIKNRLSGSIRKFIFKIFFNQVCILNNWPCVEKCSFWFKITKVYWKENYRDNLWAVIHYYRI